MNVIAAEEMQPRSSLCLHHGLVDGCHERVNVSLSPFLFISFNLLFKVGFVGQSRDTVDSIKVVVISVSVIVSS